MDGATTVPDVVSAESFLLGLFADERGGFYGQRLLLWTLQDKRSYFAPDVASAIDYIAEHCAGKDTYVGVGYSPRDFGPGLRCKAADIAGLVARWLDLDILNLAHKGKKYPPDIETALKLLALYDLKPTMIVHSGHGLQAWWKYEKPWIFENDAERARAIAESKAWSDGWRALARQNGYEVDAVGDIARVFRLPGTWNLKSEPVQVTTLDYDPSCVYQIIPTFAAPEQPSPRRVNGARLAIVETGDLVFDPDNANPPFDKWEGLQDIEPKARRSWLHKRKDLSDQSASTYDQSLACYAVEAGWADQEILDLLLAHRRKWNESPKRIDYYETTIRKARNFVDPLGKALKLAAVKDASALLQEDAPGSKDEVLERLSILFQIRVTRVVRFNSSKPVFRLETERGGVMLGDVAHILEQAKIRAKIAEVTLHIIPPVKRGEWAGVSQLLLDICETVDTGMDATDEGLARTWISAYLQHIKAVKETAQDALTSESGYVDEGGRVCIYSAFFKHWLATNQFERVTRQQLATVLSVYGCEPGRVNVRIAGQHTTRGIWRLGAEWGPPEIEPRDRPESDLVT
jgi:hypothetical protein